jgi:hypothetical protein
MRGKWGCRRGHTRPIRHGEREGERAEKELTTRQLALPFKPAEKERGKGEGGPGGRTRVEDGEGGSERGPGVVVGNTGRPTATPGRRA